MNRPYKCPVCDGEGEVPASADECGRPVHKVCHGCDGLGLLPVRQPHRCPVCEGYGRVLRWPMPWGVTPPETAIKACHGCDGKGLVWSEEPEPEPYCRCELPITHPDGDL